jgi:hypothetical protein
MWRDGHTEATSKFFPLFAANRPKILYSYCTMVILYTGVHVLLMTLPQLKILL